MKLFPILNESMFFCAMIKKENLDDVILLDQEYNIQGMSEKLYNLLKLNSSIFQDCDVPFWMICREFIHHYQTFMINNPLVKNFNSKKNNYENNNQHKSQNKTGNYVNDEETQISNKSNNSLNYSLEEINENEGAELDFEINENADVQWEVTIPPLFKLYIAEENKQKNFISLTMGIQREDSERLSSDIITENSREDDDNYDESNRMLNNMESSTGSKSLTQSYAGQDHDKEFQNAIGRYRSFFTSNNNNNFNELINLLDKLNEGNEQVFKFVISFTQIKYGGGKIGYQIRCIDNKDNIEK